MKVYIFDTDRFRTIDTDLSNKEVIVLKDIDAETNTYCMRVLRQFVKVEDVVVNASIEKTSDYAILAANVKVGGEFKQIRQMI